MVVLRLSVVSGVLATKGIPLRIATGRRAELLGVKLGFPRSRCSAIFSDVLCMRSYVHFVCVCVYMCLCMCVYVYICMCVCICTSMHLYTCVCVFVCIFVHRLWVLVSVLQRVDGVMSGEHGTQEM